MKSLLRLLPILLLPVLHACSGGEDDDQVAKDPIACIDMSVLEYAPNEQITFGNCSENAVSYKWEFGDGTTSEDTRPVHTYTSSGTYGVKLTAKNADGKESSTTATIVIGNLVLKTLKIENAKFDKANSYTVSFQQKDAQDNTISSKDNFITLDENTVFPKTYFLDVIANGDVFLLQHVYNGNMIAYELKATRSQVKDGEIVFKSSDPTYSDVKAVCEVKRE